MPPPKAVPFLSVFIRVIREIRGLLPALTLVARPLLASNLYDPIFLTSNPIRSLPAPFSLSSVTISAETPCK